MYDYRNLSNDKEKTTDQYSTTNSIDYPMYLQNLKYNLQQNLLNYQIDILNRQNQNDQDDQEPSGKFSIIITSQQIHSCHYQMVSQAFMNQQTYSFSIKHFITLNNRHLLIRDKLSINVALILSNKINKSMDNIQLIIDPVSGKIYFQTKSFINQTSLSHLKKIIPKHDCFYTQIITYSLKMAQRNIDLVLFLIGQISLQQLLQNPIIKKQFPFLSQSQKMLKNLQKSISCFGLFGKQNNIKNKSRKSKKQQSYHENINYFHKIQTQYVLNCQNQQSRLHQDQKSEKYFQQLSKNHLYQTLEFFTPNVQFTLKHFCSQLLYSNLDVSHSFNLFKKVQLGNKNYENIWTHNKTVRQIGNDSSRRSQYSKKILTIIQLLQLQGKQQDEEGQWMILSQGGFGIVQIATVRFKNLSMSYQYDSSMIIRQQLVRKRDKIQKKCKIKRQRKVLEKLVDEIHPNITSFYMSFQSEYENSLFSDYTPHMSLDLYLKKNPLSISFAQKLLFILQAIEGLIFLHSKGIVHLDIKPGNMLVHKSLRIQLSDFGEAFVIDQDNMETHQHAYTVPYCAPEIFHQPPVLSESADIYAIGVCLLKQVFEENYLETFFRKKFTQKLCKGQLHKFSIGQKFEKSILSPVFKIIQYISLIAVSQQRQKRPQLKWIREILKMCRNFIIELIY